MTDQPDTRRNADRKDARVRASILLNNADKSVTRIDGWSQDYSSTGVRFRCMSEIDQQHALFQFENMGTRAIQIEITRRHSVGRGLWEYGAKFIGVTEIPEAAMPQPTAVAAD